MQPPATARAHVVVSCFALNLRQPGQKGVLKDTRHTWSSRVSGGFMAFLAFLLFGWLAAWSWTGFRSPDVRVAKHCISRCPLHLFEAAAAQHFQRLTQ